MVISKCLPFPNKLTANEVNRNCKVLGIVDTMKEGENSHEGDLAVTGRVMDLHENEIYHLVRYLEHLELSGSCLEAFFFKEFIGA